MPRPRRPYFSVEDGIVDRIPDPTDRGIVVGLLALMKQRWRTERIDDPAVACCIELRPPDLYRLTGRQRAAYAAALVDKALRSTSARLRYRDGSGAESPRYSGGTVVVEWPNFAESQNLTLGNARKRGTERCPPEKETEKNTDTRPSGGSASPPPAPAPAADLPEATTTVARSSLWLNLLDGPVPPGFASRDAWFERHRDLLAAEATKETGETSGTRFNGAMRALLIRYWRQEQRGSRARPRSRPGIAEAAADVAAFLRETRS